MIIDFSHWQIADIELKEDGGVMTVSFNNNQQIQFLCVRYWQYNRITSAKFPIKELQHFARYIPHHLAK